MSSDPINTIAIQQFIQQVKIADASQQKEIRMDIKNAKALSFALTEVLAKLTQDYEILLKELLKASGNDTITVAMDGGGFSNK
jgi:hypothetical protein